MLADAQGIQRIGFPFDDLTPQAARARSRPLCERRFDELQFVGEWRRTSAPRSRRSSATARPGSCSTHIVAPPGSGKTLLGVELIRRVGKRALVLAPNQAIQQQWPRAVGSSRRAPRTSPAPT